MENNTIDMNNLTEEEKQSLRAIPLVEVMRANGYEPEERTKSSYSYRCPLPGHKDANASFKVEVRPTSAAAGDVPLARFNCMGCHNISGAGAIDLQARLMGVEPVGQGFWKVVTKLVEYFNIDIEGITSQSYDYRSVDPVSEFQYEETEWTDNHLRALGCRVDDIYAEPDEQGVERNTHRKSYSWAMDGDANHRRPIHTTAAELGADITMRFGVIPVSSFTIPARQSEDGKPVYSLKRFASPSYPIFVIRTVAPDGRWRVKKYEPNFRKRPGKPSYKWAWFYEGNENRNSEFASVLYGDQNVLDALYNKDVVPSETQPAYSKSIRREVMDDTDYDASGNLVTEHKFSRVCICSGPRDAMQVYYHSDCHVVYPHSETADIDSRLIKRLFLIAHKVYILFDADRTGLMRSRELNMEYLQLRNVELPAELSRLTDPRTGKPAKDASAYFELYPYQLRRGFYRHKGIDGHFDDLLSSSITCQFWKRNRVQSNSEKPLNKCHYNYSLDDDPMKQFLYYSGMCKIEQGGVFRFAVVQGNIVDLISDKAVVSRARTFMKGWLRSHPSYYDSDLSSRITGSKQVLSYDSLLDLPTVELNFKSWDDAMTYQYFFFQNGAVRVTAEGRTLEGYDTLDFYVNRKSIKPYSYVEYPDEISITDNPSFDRYEREHRQKLDLIDPSDSKALQAEDDRWEYQQLLWQQLFRLREGLRMNDLCTFWQFLADTCRFHWRKEENAKREGKPWTQWLTRDEKQFQDAHLISRILTLGYLLCRARSNAMQHIVYVTEYSVDDESRATGRTGKSLLCSLLSTVGEVCNIPGKNFKIGADVSARNFKDYDYLLHGNIVINDLNTNLMSMAEIFYNWAEGEITVKRLHQDEVEVPKDQAAKMIISGNKPFDMSADSTRGRIKPIYVSDYYHEKRGGRRSLRNPLTKFHYELGSGDTPEEFQRMINALLFCAQMFLRFRRLPYPPMDRNSSERELYAIFENTRNHFDRRFVDWANDLFRGDLLFGIPLPKVDLVVSWFQRIGRSTDEQSVRSYLYDRTFGQMLIAYCEYKHITINPDVIYAQPSLRGRLPRCKAWTYDFTPDGRLSTRRSYRDQQSCYYFFPYGTEPTNTAHVMRDQVSDPGSEGYIVE